jgi:hypothetical protein
LYINEFVKNVWSCSCDEAMSTYFLLITCLQERILLSVIGHSYFDESPDLILTEDFNGVNAGMVD